MDKADIEKYIPMLGENDLSYEKKVELLEATNLIVTSFVDMAFNPEIKNPLADIDWKED